MSGAERLQEQSCDVSRLCKVQTSTSSGAAPASKCSGWVWHFQGPRQGPGSSPSFCDLHAGAQVVLCFVFLFVSPGRVASLLLGGIWGRRMLAPISQLCLHFPVRDVWGPVLPGPWCPLQTLLFDIPVGFRRGHHVQGPRSGGRETRFWEVPSPSLSTSGLRTSRD